MATVAHVVEGGGALRVTSPTSGLVTAGQVIGFDHADDLALVKTTVALPGHVFTIDPQAPAIGTDIAAIGFPLAQSMQLSIGHITGTHDHRPVGQEFDLSDVLLSDAALNPGNSGGPWINDTGEVVALTESGPPYDPQSRTYAQGNNGGVSAADARAHFLGWQKVPEPQADRSCQPADDTDAAVETLEVYFYAIQQSDYATAYAQLWSENHPISGLTHFIDGVQSSTDVASDGTGAGFSLAGSGHSEGHVYLDVAFQSHQRAAQGPDGETCTNWTLRYQFQTADQLQAVQSSQPTPGSPGHTTC